MSSGAFSLTTKRLVLREFLPGDARALCRLNAHPDVMRYTGEDPFASEEAARAFIENYRHYAEHGFGRWAVTDIDSGRFMGFCGLEHSPAAGGVDLAFRLFPEYWASGYATEAARACLAAAFDDFELDDVLGRAMRENLPSITVLRKLGMRYRRMLEDRGLFWLIYGITREEYAASPRAL